MTETAETPTSTGSSKLSAWKRAAGPAQVTLPSGTKVGIVIPDLPEMLRAGHVPNELVKFAQDTQEAIKGVEEFDLEKITEATDFMRFMVAATVRDPDISPDDVPDLPTLDRDMILEFAMRQRDVDAVGHQLHGLELVAEWRRFRRGPAGD